jgi:hypothetical protein
MGAFRKSNVGSAVEKAIDEAVEFISQQLDKIPWEGSIVAVKGNKVYINRGAREGVKTGQQFQVGTMERITDPDTGEVLDISVTRVAGIKVDEVKDKLSIASITDGNENIQKGMTVVLP